MDNNCFNNIYDSFVKNKIGHAILIETNNSEICYKKVTELVKKLNCPNNYSSNCSECDICYQIDNRLMPSVITIEAMGQSISKENILDLIEYFNKKSMYIKYNIYIIKEAEKLNESSANALLKFLEEPPEEVIAFLITKSKQNVIPTISSRCQHFRYFIESDEEIPQDILDLADKYLDNVFCKDNKIYLNKNFFSDSQMSDRNFFSLFFRGILLLLRQNSKWDINKTNLIKILNITSDYVLRTVVYVNVPIMLDNYYIKLKEIIK